MQNRNEIKENYGALVNDDNVIFENNAEDEVSSLLSDSFSFFDVFKRISSLSFPMALSYTFSFEVFLITIMLTLLNPDDEQEIASATLVATMMNTMVIMGFSPLFSLSMLASNKVGELKIAEESLEDAESLTEKRDYISAYNRNGLLIASAMTPAVWGSLFFSKTLLQNVFRQEEDVSELAQQFLRTYSIAVPGLMTRMSFEQVMFSFGCAKPAMVLGLGSLGIGTLLSYGLGFYAKFGASGLAAGYIAEAYLTATLYGLYLAKHEKFRQFEFFNFCKKITGSLDQLKELVRTGAPISFTVANEMAISLSVGMLAGIVGDREQAATTSAMQAVFFSFIPLSAFGQACSQEVSREIGAKRYDNASNLGKYGLLTSMIYMTPFPVVCALQPNILLLASGKNQANFNAILKTLMPIISSGIICDAARYNILQQLRALGDFKGSTIISVGGLSIGIGVSSGLGLKTNMGIYGVGIGYTFGIALSGAGLLYRWQNRIKSENIRIADVQRAENVSRNSASFFRADKRGRVTINAAAPPVITLTSKSYP